AVDAVLRQAHLPVDVAQVRLRRQLVVVPVDRDRRLAGGDRLRRDVDRLEVPGLRQLGEEVDAGRDVVERTSIGEGGGEDTREGRVRLARIVVQRDLVPA